MTAAPALVTALEAVRAVASRCLTASDDELLEDAATTEAIGRLLDSLRVTCAAEIERRSIPGLGDGSLAFRKGARNGTELVEKVALIDGRTARARIGLGAAIAPTASLQGDPLPGKYAVVGDAVMAGEIGLDSARIIVDGLQRMRPRASSEELGMAESSLVDTARTERPENLRVHVEVWTARLDPDGAEPDDERRRRRRAFRLGKTEEDGATRFFGLLMPEDLAMVKELLQSRRRTGILFRTTAGGDDTCETIEPEWREGEGLKRPRRQQDYDTIIDALRAAIRAEQDATSSPTATTHEIIVVAKATDLEQRKGFGWTPGLMTGLSVPTIERMACGGTVRLLVTGAKGEPLFLDRSQRIFTNAQKKALIAWSGGCAVPGCTVPHPYVEAHHAAWWQRDDGRTDIDNGVLVCSYHHHLLHSTNAPIRIIRHEGHLYVVPSGWVGPPEERHRVQRHPLTDVREDPPPPAMPNPWTSDGSAA